MKHFHKIGLGLILILMSTPVFYFHLHTSIDDNPLKKKIKSSSSPRAGIEMKKARLDYFFNMLKDPATNEIPPFIRQRELEFAEKLNQKNTSVQKSLSAAWSEAGPNNVGGRTRALAVDVANPNIILAGGASGGIWKSTDKGSTWKLKSTSSQILSVTSVAQDTRPGKTNIWYYTSGEYEQNLAGSYASYFFGNGVYKSTDNGETWNILSSTYSADFTQWDKDFDFCLRVVVSPVNGNVFVAVNGSGIFRSTDEGNSFTRILGGVNHHIFSDISVASNGNLIAVVSSPYQGITPAKTAGVYKSTDNGQNWTNITVTGLPALTLKGIISFAPSNPNTAYLLNFGLAGNNEVVKFYKINFNAGTSEDRSANIPDFRNQYPQTGFFNPQGGYNLTLAVKPDDENFVLIGATNIFRSANGFATKPTDAKTTWIGGYLPVNGIALYPNSHPDIHSYAFDPTDPKKMWWGHDGGLSYTTDITNNSFAQYFPWESKNNGYNVTQFYHISIAPNSGDNRIMGGCQDNGTPYFVYTNSVANQVDDVSSGDGSFSYFGQNFAYTSAQNGAVIRLRYDQQKNPVWNGWSEVSPTGAANQLFIHPFVIDPNNENIMYYPAGNVLWRNNQLGSIPDGSNGTTMGWSKLDNIALPAGYGFTALTASNNPANVLYYAGNKSQSAPKLYKLSNASTATSGAVELTIAGAPSGSYINNIAVNPDDANEILVVMSNYNIVGLYHSVNGGQSFTPIEGNLTGTQQSPGPSLRAATILPGKGYYLATSIGVFSTTQLNGNNTNWVQEGQNVMGNVIVSHITSRTSDGRVVAGTHGRGAFVATAGGGGNAVLNVSASQLSLGVKPGETGEKTFSISNSGAGNLSFNINVSGGPGLTNIYPQIPKSTLILSETQTGFLPASRSISSQKYNSRYSDVSIPNFPLETDELILDDGNNTPAGFLGMGGGVHFYTANDFKLDKDFSLEKVKFFMKTEGQNTNPIGIAVTKGDAILFDQTINMSTSPASGKWFEYDFPQNVLNNLKFQNGESFQVIVIAQNTLLTFPSGYDDNALKPGNSYWAYFDPLFNFFSGWQNLNTISVNGAWLIRAVGNSGSGGTNQLPVANAQVSPNPANINEQVNFNGSGSSDPDGQITQYMWEFGDGATSSQMNTAHSYSQAGQYNYKLTVTDDKGGKGTTSGQITINSSQQNRWTINPASGNISAGGSQNITISYNAAGLTEGTHQAQLTVTSNGGNAIIPITLIISSTVDVEDKDNILTYMLEQNYPNPFNPSTKIRWALKAAGMVSIKIFNIDGSEITTLVDEYKEAGNHEILFDTRKINLPSGVYIYKIHTGNFTDSKKLVLIK